MVSKELNLVGVFLAAESSADFRMILNAVGEKTEPVATIASFAINDPNLQEKLAIACQAFRMGARFGKEE